MRALTAALILLNSICLGTTEYFVRLDGKDTGKGTTPQTAFATIQRGVDALEPGDTLMVLPGRSNLAELKFMPGVFYHDREAGRLYITTVDNRPAEEHAYSLSVLAGNGLHLASARHEVGPRRVMVEGLAATGFNAATYEDGEIGIALENARHCLFMKAGQARAEGKAPGTIILSEEADVDPEAGFADSVNRDYRLQATSRFRGTGPGDSALLHLPFVTL